MKKLISAVCLLLLSFSASALNVSYFTGSLYMFDVYGAPIIDPNYDCTSCDSLAGEVDNNLSSVVDFTTGTSSDIIGNNPLFGTGNNWWLGNLSFVNNATDGTTLISGQFFWNNSVGLTTSTFSQLIQPLGANGEVIALDGDGDGIKGTVMIDGPFQGLNIYIEGRISPVPLPATAWLLGSGLLALAGFARRKMA